MEKYIIIYKVGFDTSVVATGFYEGKDGAARITTAHSSTWRPDQRVEAEATEATPAEAAQAAEVAEAEVVEAAQVVEAAVS